MAAKLGFLDLVELLINYGADVGARDSEGNNPAQFAKEEGYKDILEVLPAP